MIKAVLFDFDGVLTLDGSGSESTCKYICAATGIDRNIFENEYRKYNVGLLTGKLKHEEVWGKICTAIGRDIHIEILYDSFINTPINFEMLKLVRQLKDKKFKIGMVTDNKADRIKSIIEYHRWEDIFDGIAVSAEVGSGKNQENIFHKIFQTLNLNPDECIFIDNNRDNLVIPNVLGLSTIFFDHNTNDIIGLKNKLAELGIEI